MLADDVLSERTEIPEVDRCLEFVSLKIKSAQRFVLEKDFISAADQVMEAMPSSVLTALPLCRPPYETTWFEYVGSDRPGTPSAGTGVPHRVGWLIDADPENFSRFTVCPVWRHKSARSAEICPMALVLDFSPEAPWLSDPFLSFTHQGFSEDEIVKSFVKKGDSKAKKILASSHEIKSAVELERRVFVVPNPYFAEVGSKMVAMMPKVELEKAFEQFRLDAEAEIQLIVASMVLINSKNGTDQEEVGFSEFNRKRIKRGKLPLLSYRNVKLRVGRAARVAMHNSGMSEKQIRAHLVRGHFKLRKTGVFWWAPFARGNVKSGMVVKDYAVTTN